MFKKKKTPKQVAVRVILVMILALVLVFLGYSVGKPVLEFIGNLGSQSTPDIPDEPDQPSQSDILPADDGNKTDDNDSDTDLDDNLTDNPDDFTEPEPENIKSGILYVTFNDTESPSQTLANAVKTALANNCKGICLDLVSDGGQINYASNNALAADSQAIRADALDLTEAVNLIKSSGLVPYAHISALSDHIASWYDRSICYQFEDGSSKWLDNSLSAGGKPWISPFSDNAKEYISDLVCEISSAGFKGLTASEFEFPPFRTKDLSYIGDIVRTDSRYTALCDFSNAIFAASESGEFYAIEVDALDLLEGNCEVLTDPSLINADFVYLKYSSADIGTRITKPDDSVVSFEGLDEQYKLAQVLRLAVSALDGTDIKIVPAVDSPLEYAAILEVIDSVGLDASYAVIF